MAETPNSGEQGAATEDRAPRQIVVHAQYIKDLSFENPNAPDILIDPPSQPDVEIGVNVGARGLNSEQYEVMLSLSARAKAGEKSLFLAELTYAAIVSAPGTERDDLNPLIMIEAPRLMFPFARAIISDMTRDGGFMPLSIQPIDFVAVYQNNLGTPAGRKRRGYWCGFRYERLTARTAQRFQTGSCSFSRSARCAAFSASLASCGLSKRVKRRPEGQSLRPDHPRPLSS